MTSAARTNDGRFRFGIRSLFILLAVCAVLFAAFGWFHRQMIEPRRASAAVEQRLKSLAGRRPKDMTPRQWESAVAWTQNLHGNSLMFAQADGPTIRRFEGQLAKKLAGDVNMETIHWIWDRYADICPGGANYQRFKPMMMEEIEQGGANWGMNIP
jgi:hypothetical protein